MVSAPFRIRLKHACATLRGRIPLAQILELQIMADANDISNAASALQNKLGAYVAQSQANFTALQDAKSLASTASDQAVAAINAAADAIPDVSTIGGTVPVTDQTPPAA